MLIREFSMSPLDIQKKFPHWKAEILGSDQVVVHKVSSPEGAGTGSIIFCATPDSVTRGSKSKASVLVTKLEFKDKLSSFNNCVMFTSQPDVNMAEFLQTLVIKSPYKNQDYEGVSPRAFVHSTAEIHKTAVVAPGAHIAAGVKLAEGVFVGANSVIEAECEIGNDTVIHPLVYIGHSTKVGARCEIYPNTTIAKEGFGYATSKDGKHFKIPHSGRVMIEDDVHIGSNSAIDRATFDETRIGAGTKLDNLIHIAHNCSMGRGCVAASGFAMAGSSHVGNYFVGGGKSSVTGHVRVGDGVRIAALSAVSKSLNEPGEYGGVPMVPIREHIRQKAAMMQLPEMRKQLADLMKKIFPPD